MKNSLVILSLVLFSCQRSDFNSRSIDDSRQVLNLEAQKTSSIQHLKRLRSNKPTVACYAQHKKQAIGENYLIAHSRFAFLGYAGKEPISWEQLEDHTNAYEGESSIFYTFKLDVAQYSQFEHLIGQKLVLNNGDREQMTRKIIDIVLVEDIYNELPYYAAVLETDPSKSIYYGWTSRYGSLSYPFREVQLVDSYATEESENPVLIDFQNTNEFTRFEEQYSTSNDEVYLELSGHEFESKGEERYMVVQYKAIGLCEGLVDETTALYAYNEMGWRMIASGSLGYFFKDLIDVNGDGFPEILGADFASSSIISIENGMFINTSELSWSTMGCPC